MRDPARISRIMRLLEEYWSMNPDLRLGQLMVIISGLGDPFYYEDAEIEQRLILGVQKLRERKGL